jgi:hypothetical protein
VTKDQKWRSICELWLAKGKDKQITGNSEGMNRKIDSNSLVQVKWTQGKTHDAISGE